MNSNTSEAFIVLQALCHEFGIELKNVLGKSLVSSRSFGLEVKVPVRAHFPLIWEEYVTYEHKERVAQLSMESRRAFSEALARVEVPIKMQLQRTRNAGLKAGPWKLWEFILPPTQNVHEIIGILRVLMHQDVGLIHNVESFRNPKGVVYPLHMTIGGLTRRRNTYMLLAMLELLWCSPVRMRAWNAWDAKGKSGIHERTKDELLCDTVACELRTLQLPPPEKLEAFFESVVYLLHVMDSNKSLWLELTGHLGRMLKNHGLQDQLWGSPSREGDSNWKKYADHFSVMSTEWKHYVRKYYGEISM